MLTCMPTPSRRNFLQTAAAASALNQARGQNNRVNVAVVGVQLSGMDHVRAFARMPDVRIVALCDVDQRLFAPAVAEVERLGGYRPETETDMRRLLERKDIDAISLGTPDYWHALQTIWACQA